ncbi:A24 family peptidase [Halobacillus sp. A5]|uniref:prepilin peptidase n=1 Tax=Halobacillus sp. A5 TaxID=2880263 RepID=UPI0020A6D64E|nr:A24 family peptidase [Halobacillus sp. A5]MCP3025534.1 prepilin peptidase [Halobacillus sp. A5]
MTILLTIYLFLAGLVLGSFFNVVGLRLPRGELFTRKRSYCPCCHHTLSWYELIPVLSYMYQKARCRHCRHKISPLYPAMEIFSGTAFAYSCWMFGFNPSLILALLLISMFHIIVVTDLRYMMIPDKVLLFFTVLFIVYRIAAPTDPWWDSAAGALVGLLGTLVIIIVSRGGMGGGDMKLFAVLGLALGTSSLLLTFFFASLLGTVGSIVLLLSKIISREKPIPFGPYIAAGGLITIFHGEFLINWYISSFF